MADLFLVSDRFSHHRKVLAIPRSARNRSVGLWTLAGCWSARHHTGGDVPREVVRALRARTPTAHALVRCGLWDATSDGYAFHDGDGLWRFARTGERVPIPDAVRQAIYRRDGYRCVECGSPDDLTIDHVFPWVLGGSDDPSNLQTLCRPCNSRKGARVGG